MRWSAKLECFGRVLGAVVRWTSCLVSYCVVAPYFLCYLVFVGGTSLPVDADDSCAAYLPIVTESSWSISLPTPNATLPLTPPSINSFHLRPQIFNLIHLLCGILFFSLPESFFRNPALRLDPDFLIALLLASNRHFLAVFALNPHSWHQSSR